MRDQANKTLELYLSRIRKHALTLPDTVAPPANGTASDPHVGAPQSSADATWTGWAISSFTNKLASASGEMSSKPPPVVVGGATAKAPVTLQPTKTGPASSGRPTSITSDPVKPALNRHATPTTKLAASFTAPEIVEDDWGKDDWGGADESVDANTDGAWGAMAEDVAPTATATSVAPVPMVLEAESLSPDVETPKPTPKRKQDTGGEPDFASWLNAQKSTKNAKPLPKGLAAHKSSSSLGSKTGQRPLTSRTSTGSGSGVKKIVQPPKPPEKKDEAGEDEWGDSW